MLNKLILILAFALSLISCSDHHFLGEFNTINSRDEIKGMITTCAKDVSKNGLQAKLKYFSHDINSFWILNETSDPLQNYNEYYKNWGAKNKLIKYEIDDMSIQVFHICEERASFYYKATMVYTDSLGKQIDLQLLESGTVMKLNEGSNWEYLNGHTSIVSIVQ
ncbi:MAG: hypothetical protein V4677_06275 [Bacteroidota bacterium]